MWILCPILVEDGLLCVNGRLKNSALFFDEMHPFIMPKGHFALLLMRFQYILLKHAGVDSMLFPIRAANWVIGACRLAKQVKSR